MNALQPNVQTSRQPSLILTGNSGYQIQHDRVVVTVDAIRNQREAVNLSGTLRIELWALSQPYSGGDFQGIALAGTSIGELAGQQALNGCCYDLIFHAPPEGAWYLTLMLREWEGSGYLTRDYVNFAAPYRVEHKSAATRSEDGNVITVDFGDSSSKASTKTALKTTQQTVVNKARTAASKATVTTVSLNDADISDIAALKGVSQKVAANIIASRPFDSLEALLKVKGIGKKLLENIRSLITL